MARNCIICLSLGVGLNVTMFSVVDGVLIQGLPFHDAESLRRVWSANLKARTPRAGVSYEDFRGAAVARDRCHWLQFLHWFWNE